MNPSIPNTILDPNDLPGNSRPLNLNCSTLPPGYTGLSYRENADYHLLIKPDIVTRTSRL